jgi:hypothetical protein
MVPERGKSKHNTCKWVTEIKSRTTYIGESNENHKTEINI